MATTDLTKPTDLAAVQAALAQGDGLSAAKLVGSAAAQVEAQQAALDQAQALPNRTLAEFKADTVPAPVLVVVTSGWISRGDLGDASYKRVSSQPTHAGKFQDASGAWFEQMPGEFRPQQFGGFPGDADATPAIQAALYACAALGGKVRVSTGNWYAGDIIHPNEVEAFGDGEDFTFVYRRAGPALTRGVWSFPLYRTATVNGVPNTVLEAGRGTNITLRDMTLDATGHVNEPWPILNLGDMSANVKVLNVRPRNTMGRWAVRCDLYTACRDIRLLVHCEDCPAGGIIILPSVKGSTNIDASYSTFKRVGNNILSIHDVESPPDVNRFNCNFNVNLDFIQISEVLNTGAYGPIPIEAWGCTGLSIRFFQIDGGTRGITAGVNTIVGVIGPGKISNQTFYAMEAGNSRKVTVRGLEASNCATLINFTGGSGGINEVRDFIFEDVILIGTGLTAYNASAGQDVIKLDNNMNHYGSIFRRVTIRDAEYVRSVLRIKVPAGSDITFIDPVIEARTPYSCNNAIDPGGLGDVKITRPRFKRTADMPSDHYQPDAVVFGTPTRTVGTTGSVRYEEAESEITGSVAAMTAGALQAFGSLGAAAPYAGLTITGSKAIGNYRVNAIAIPDNTGLPRIEIDTSRVLSGGISLASAIIDRRTKRTIEGDATPASGTYDTGTIMKPRVPTASGVIERQCVAGGTPGIWVDRYGIGADPTIPGSYASISTLTSSPLLRASGVGATLKLRCDAAAGVGQPPVAFTIFYSSRNNNNPRAGRTDIAFGSFSDPVALPIYTSTSLDGNSANAAVVGTPTADASGRLEVPITFPGNGGGASFRIEGIARNATAWASYSAVTN